MGRKEYRLLNNRPGRSNIIQFVLTLFSILLFCSQAYGVDYTLSWDANSEPDIAGYRIYYKANSSGQPSGDYDVSVDVGNVTSGTIENLDESTVYYFAVTAYDTSGLESDFSNEISTAAEITLPDQGSSSYLMTLGNEPDSIALRAEGGSITDGFNWSLAPGSVGSLSAVTNERTVIYTSPPSIQSNSATATVVLRNDAGTLLGQQVITIYNALTIINKLADNQSVSAGEATEPFTAQGGNGSYTWTVRKDGNLVDISSGASYVFNVPEDAGGNYTITVTDGNNFTDSFDVDVIDNMSPSPTKSIVHNYQEISGYIVNDNGFGIGNANVTLISPKQFASSTFTDDDGSFSFSNIPDVNKYNFSVSKNGYISTEFSSDDLLNDIILKNADSYVTGEITIDGVSFSGTSVEVTISYIINGFGILAGKAKSSNGEFRIDFEEVLGISEYILTATRPGEYGETVVRSLPGNGVTIDIDTSLAGDDVNALAGGSSYPVSIAGQTVSIVRVPFGSIDPASGVIDINVDITTVANTASTCTSGSGNLLYNIDMDYEYITTILTLPFDLEQVAPGDFENGNAIIYHADSVDELTYETNLREVFVDDIISIDYIGDGSTGLVEFYTDSLSVFGVGSGGNSSASGLSSRYPTGGDAGSCFITTVADTGGDTVGFQRLLILLGVIVAIGGISWKLKRDKARSQKSEVSGQFL